MRLPLATLPTKQQETLLRAALSPPAEAYSAWRDWKQESDVNRLDINSQRLLPLVYRNLSRGDTSDPDFNVLKRHYEITWFKNQLVFKRIGSILQLFEQAGIPVLVLKGVPLTVLYYKDYGVRPMDDVDLLVPIDEGPRAAEILLDMGWHPKHYAWEKALSESSYFHSRQSQNFYNSQPLDIDLHWQLFLKNGDEMFWASKQQFKIQATTASTMNAADLLLHACARGLEWNSSPVLRWVVDSNQIIQTCNGKLNWDRLVHLAHDHQATLPLQQTLGYLKLNFGIPIPDRVLQDLRKTDKAYVELVTYWANTRYPGPLQKIVSLLGSYVRYCHLARISNPFRLIAEFPRFLKYYWGYQQLWKIPGLIIFKTTKNVISFLRRSVHAV